MLSKVKWQRSDFQDLPALAAVAQWTECRPANPKLLVRFPVRAHAWVAGQVPIWGRARGNQSMYFSHINVSLPLSHFLTSL